MTDISKMTDADLRLAIAGIIAKQKGYTVAAKEDFGDLFFAVDNEDGSMTLYEPVPNYPCDPAAALGLLEGMESEIKLSKEGYAWVEIKVRFDPKRMADLVAKADAPTLARAISEPTLEALKAKGE